MFFQINDMRLKTQLASAAAATVITSMMLVCVSLGFPGLVHATAKIEGSAAVTTAKVEFAS